MEYCACNYATSTLCYFLPEECQAPLLYTASTTKQGIGTCILQNGTSVFLSRICNSLITQDARDAYFAIPNVPTPTAKPLIITIHEEPVNKVEGLFYIHIILVPLCYTLLLAYNTVCILHPPKDAIYKQLTIELVGNLLPSGLLCLYNFIRALPMDNHVLLGYGMFAAIQLQSSFSGRILHPYPIPFWITTGFVLTLYTASMAKVDPFRAFVILPILLGCIASFIGAIVYGQYKYTQKRKESILRLTQIPTQVQVVSQV